MDIQPQTTDKPISDDQELAKALAGITSNSNDDIGFEETPSTPYSVTTPAIDGADGSTTTPAIEEPENQDISETTPPIETPAPEQPAVEEPETVVNENTSGLDDIKKDALVELRPLVDKLDVAPEEKFDIYLLLLRSTDDKTLIAPAHEAARNIADETRRAQALLDIIKEIDYLSTPQQS